MAYKKTSRNHWLSGDGNTLYSYGCEVCHVENGKSVGVCVALLPDDITACV